jgi:hypothetical protein
VAGTKRATAPSGSTPPPKRPYRGIWKPRFVRDGGSSSSSGAATATGTAAPTIGTTAAEAAVGVTPGSATSGKPQTPKGVPEDVSEESEEEPEMAPEPVPEVVPEEVPAEGAMITVHVAAPSPSHGAPAPSSPVPRIATATGVASGTGLEVVLGHPTPYVSDDIPLGEAMSMAHRALSQVQRLLRREGEDLADERRRLQLWASMLMRTTVSGRAATWAR